MIRSLSSFRFITALVVFFYHCRPKTESDFINQFFSSGFVFMTGFFVLSGFIMAHVYSNTDFTRRENIFNFYLKRFAKIYPTYAFATIVYFYFLHDYTSQQISTVVITNPFLVQGFFPNIFAIGINGGTWSLTVEMFLYFLFPFLILLSAKSPKILIFSLLIAAITSLNVFIDKSEEYIYANPVIRLADFMCGMGFYFLKDKFKEIRFANLLQLAIVFLLVYICVNFVCHMMNMQFIIVPLFGVWITMVYHSESKIYNNKILEYLGLISYSFYLWQFFSIELGKELFKNYPNINVNMVIMIQFILNLLISIFSYHFFEERVRKFILIKFANKTRYN